MPMGLKSQWMIAGDTGFKKKEERKLGQRKSPELIHSTA